MKEKDIKTYSKLTNMIEHSFKSVDERANRLKIFTSKGLGKAN